MSAPRKKIRKMVIIACLAAVFAAGPVQAADDTLMGMLPDDCLFCMRINDMDASLNNLDAYLTGISPWPLGLMVKGKFSQIVGDPMMTGIDTGGNFAVVGLSEETTGLLVPMTNYADFVGNNPNCTEGDDGMTLLTSPNSPFPYAMVSAADGKYAIVVPEFKKADLATLKAAIGSNGTFGEHLSQMQARQAVTAPVWAYINTARLYAQYGPMLLNTLDEAQEKITAAIASGEAAEMAKMGDMIQFGFKMYGELFKTFAGDADSVTIALTPEAGALTLDVSLKAKDGSQTATMLVADPAGKDGFTLTGFLNNDNAVNALVKMNRPAFQKLYDLLFEAMDSSDMNGLPTMEKMKTLTRKSFAAMGDEAAVSFSYAGEKPPFKFTEVYAVHDMDAMQEVMSESMPLVSDFYGEIGIPLELIFQPNTSRYKNADISTMLIAPKASETSDDSFAETMEMIYGGTLTYLMGNTDKLYYLAMGPDVENELKALIDRDGSAPATGEVKAAFDLLQDSGYDDFVCSINIIKLVSGWGQMFGSISELHGGANLPIPLDMLTDINVPSQSSLAVGGKIADGQLSTRIVLPKEHLVELMTVGNQMQQKMMQQMMQENAPVQ